MSFSSDVKEELERRSSGAKHCQIAELAGLLAFSGKVRRARGGSWQLLFTTENRSARTAYMELLGKAFAIGEDKLSVEKEGRRVYTVRLADEALARRVLMAIKWMDPKTGKIEPVFVHDILIQREDDRKAFLRGAFLAAGSLTDPRKQYHMEIVCSYAADAKKMTEIFWFFHIDARTVRRKNSTVVYIKEAGQITDALNLMGAVVSQMDLTNVVIYKEVRNEVNRKVNCETANSNKTAVAAVRQIKAIEKIRDTIGLESLTPQLRDIAQARLENPELDLRSLGQTLDPPVGKSGVNHRLRRLIEIAESGTTADDGKEE
ncbi:MAG: DNA-binding protein WhiA [Lachnospiraceae bacterium]|jgi:DNA-binding protein WhiA